MYFVPSDSTYAGIAGVNPAEEMLEAYEGSSEKLGKQPSVGLVIAGVLLSGLVGASMGYAAGGKIGALSSLIGTAVFSVPVIAGAAFLEKD
jgi:hypothetical protein